MTQFATTAYGALVYRSDDASAIYIIPDLLPEYFQGTPPKIITVPTVDPPVALGRVKTRTEILPMWVERGGSGDLHLRFADVDQGGAITVYAAPYPFADGTAPSLITSYERFSALLIDQSSTPPYDLLVALIVVRAPDDIVTWTIRQPAPGGMRGLAVESTNLDTTDSVPFVQQVVQFFDQPGSYAEIEDEEPPGDPLGEHSPFTLSVDSTGSWPFHVVAADGWYKLQSETGDPLPTFTHPVPFISVSDSGDVFAWQYDHGPAPEEFLVPFGHVSPNTRIVYGNADALWALQPDGSALVLGDSDSTALQPPSLTPLSYSIISPWTSAIPIRPNSPSTSPIGFIADSAAYFWP